VDSFRTLGFARTPDEPRYRSQHAAVRPVGARCRPGIRIRPASPDGAWHGAGNDVNGPLRRAGDRSTVTAPEAACPGEERLVVFWDRKPDGRSRDEDVERAGR
jgi:hypothetical protein